MLPVLLQIGPVTIYTYGLMAATGFMVGTWIFVRNAKKGGGDPEIALDIAFYIVVAGLVGARLLYVIIEWKEYLQNPLHIFAVWEGGLVFLGGFVGAIVAGLWIVKKRKVDFWQYADWLVPGLALAHAFGRIGCFGAGCCYGKVTDSGFGVVYHHPDSLAPLNVPLFPTQLMESGYEVGLFLLLTAMAGKKKFHGQLLTVWMMLYALGRFSIEFLRGDPRGFAGPVSTSQLLVLFLFAAGAWFYKQRAKTAKR